MKSTNVDPLTLSIIDQRLQAVTEEIAINTNRAAYSMPTAYLHDLGVMICDRNGRLVTQAEFGMAGHVAGSNVSMEGFLNYIGRDNWRPNDFAVGNDPFIVRAGHLPDWCFVRPVFYKGELVFFMFLKTHQYDTGGSYPSTYYPRSFDAHAEGLIIPPTKIVEEGKIDEKTYGLILKNVRGAPMVRMDNMLVRASMTKADERIQQICDEYGLDTVKAAYEQVIKQTEEAVRREVSTWKGGTYTVRRAGDCDGTTRDPVWLTLHLTVKPETGELIFDFTDNPKQVDYINTPLGIVWAFVVIPLRWTLPPGKYTSQGLINCLTVKTVKGTVCDPVYPATSGGCAPSLGGQIIECTQLAMSLAAPKKAPACWSRHCQPIFAGKHPTALDPRTGSRKWYWLSPFTSDGSSGAIWGYDGWDSLDDPETAGGAMRSSIEASEAEWPWRWLWCEWFKDSAGNGQWRGGMGTDCAYISEQSAEGYRPGDIVIITGNSNGEKFATFGIAGAPDGIKTKMWLKRRRETHILHTQDILPGEPGDIVITKSQGGGGVGDPLDRDVESVRIDLMNEIISEKTARDVYGVAINPDTFEVDYEATKRLRSRKRGTKKRN